MSKHPQKNVLVIGSGGRENAIGWKLAQSPDVKALFFAPGNGGTQQLGTNLNVKETDVQGILQQVHAHDISTIVIGPETALFAGVSDALRNAGKEVFGPSQKAAQLETSKAFAVGFMEKYNIPHPKSWACADKQEAMNVIKEIRGSYVIKADGLAAGKGVFLPESIQEASENIDHICKGDVTGSSKNIIVIQERLEGPEASIIAITDGKTIIACIPAQDHKRVFDGNRGPNTGGMGAFAPSCIDTATQKIIQETILEPSIRGMADMGIPYKGVLYAGIILTKQGPQVIEYNARFGDPETQPLMTMLDSDLLSVIEAVTEGTLSTHHIKFKQGASVCVVLAEAGYPGNYEIGHKIYGLSTIEEMQDVFIFHAGTRTEGDSIMTNGGRVLGVTAHGKNIDEAFRKAYNAIGPQGVWFEGMHFRRDIGLSEK